MPTVILICTGEKFVVAINVCLEYNSIISIVQQQQRKVDVIAPLYSTVQSFQYNMVNICYIVPYLKKTEYTTAKLGTYLGGWKVCFEMTLFFNHTQSWIK